MIKLETAYLLRIYCGKIMMGWPERSEASLPGPVRAARRWKRGRRLEGRVGLSRPNGRLLPYWFHAHEQYVNILANFYLLLTQLLKFIIHPMLLICCRSAVFDGWSKYSSTVEKSFAAENSAKITILHKTQKYRDGKFALGQTNYAPAA